MGDPALFVDDAVFITRCSGENTPGFLFGQAFRTLAITPHPPKVLGFFTRLWFGVSLDVFDPFIHPERSNSAQREEREQDSGYCRCSSEDGCGL
jgi:hypothetical protein